MFPLLIGALFALTLIAPGGVAAATPTPTALTPELATLGTAAVAAQPPAAQAEAIGLPAEGAGSLAREGGRVIVEAHFKAGALARLEALQAAGAKILFASSRYQTVTLSIEPEDLAALAEVPGLSVIEPSRRPALYGVEGGAGTAVATPNELCEGGSVVSQGVAQLNVPAVREVFGARGAGETIGVLSDSFDSATESIEGGPLASDAADDEITNDLPGPAGNCGGQQVPVDVIEEAPPVAPGEEGHTDEGRAMLQVVHDLAPHAKLAFATAFVSELGFARNIERLAEPVASGGAGANVIVDDVGYFTEPFFQDGPVAVAIQRVTEAGVTYLTAAGNNNLFEGKHEIASWERSEFHDTTCPTVLNSRIPVGSRSNCMNFSPTGTDSTFGITVKAKETLIIDLQWEEPWYGVETDLNAYLLSENEKGVLYAHPLDNVAEGGEGGGGAFPAPTELIGWENPSTKSTKVELVIDRCTVTCNSGANPTTRPRLKFELLEDGSGVTATEYPESNLGAGIVVGPTIYGHAGSAAAITLGAINYEELATTPKAPEAYSSRGPVTNYFGPVTSTTPAAELVTPEVLEKPDLTATDCASTTFFAQLISGSYHFCGTSEAGPHAAAVAALMRQTEPLASPKLIAEKMEESATKFTVVKSPNAVGAGLLNAAEALTALGGSPVVDPPSSIVSPIGKVEEKKGPPTPPPTPAPTVSITKGPASLTNERRPTFEFTASASANFTCQIDGGAAVPCGSPYVVPTALADGPHGFAVTATNAQGSGSGGPWAFTVDTKAPRTRIVGHPANVVRTRKPSAVVKFRLKASESPVTFYCQVDREPLRICGATYRHRFAVGHHMLKVRAKDGLGNIATAPATFRFRVKELGRRRSAR